MIEIFSKDYVRIPNPQGTNTYSVSWTHHALVSIGDVVLFNNEMVRIKEMYDSTIILEGVEE